MQNLMSLDLILFCLWLCGEHPLQFIDCIKRQLSINEMRIKQYLSGNDPTKKKRSIMIVMNKFFKRLVSTYDELGVVVDYLSI